MTHNFHVKLSDQVFQTLGPKPAQQYHKDLAQETVKSNASVKTFLLKFHELNRKLLTGFPTLGEGQSRALTFVLESGLRQLTT